MRCEPTRTNGIARVTQAVARLEPRVRRSAARRPRGQWLDGGVGQLFARKWFPLETRLSWHDCPHPVGKPMAQRGRLGSADGGREVITTEARQPWMDQANLPREFPERLAGQIAIGRARLGAD